MQKSSADNLILDGRSDFVIHGSSNRSCIRTPSKSMTGQCCALQSFGSPEYKSRITCTRKLQQQNHHDDHHGENNCGACDFWRGRNLIMITKRPSDSRMRHRDDGDSDVFLLVQLPSPSIELHDTYCTLSEHMDVPDLSEVTTDRRRQRSIYRVHKIAAILQT